MHRFATVLLLAGCATAPVNVVVKAEPWLQHESQLLKRSVTEYLHSRRPITVTIRLEPAVLDIEHASLVATYVVADETGRRLDEQTVRVQRDHFEDAGRAIAEHVAQIH